MQDKATGNMIPMEELSGQMVNDLSDHGFCVVSKGEKVQIKGVDFIVDHFDKHNIMLKCPEDFYDRMLARNFDLQLNECVKVKNGHFKIQHFGAMFLKLRGLPANEVVNQDLIDDYRKKQIEETRKDMSYVVSEM